MRGRDRAGALAAATLALAACAPLATYRSAEPLGRGRWRAQAALGLATAADTEQETRTPLGHLELGVARGVTDTVDVGARAYVAGLEATTALALSSTAGDRWGWALAGAFGGARYRDRPLVADGLALHARVAAIATRRTSRAWAWSTGPVLTTSALWFDGGGRAAGVLLGGFGNAERRLGDRWRLTTELSLHVTAVGDVPVRGAVAQLGAAIAVDL